MDRRRFLLASLAGAVAIPISALGQSPPKTPRIGIIGERALTDPFLVAFRAGLRELGYVEGHSIVIESRYAHADLDRIPGLTADLIRSKIDVLVVGGTESAQRARKVAGPIPIVFATAGDPVESGLASSLAHPGGTLTGLSIFAPELSAKQLELLKAALPRLSRVTVLYNPANPARDITISHLQDAARVLVVELRTVEVRQRAEIARTLPAVLDSHPGALLIVSDPVFGSELTQFAKLARTRRLAAVYLRKEFAEAGGLFSYGPSFADNYRRVATYVDKILKGAKPSDLPIERPTKLELVINLKTAKGLGLTIPPSVLARADQVIE